MGDHPRKLYGQASGHDAAAHHRTPPTSARLWSACAAAPLSSACPISCVGNLGNPKTSRESATRHHAPLPERWHLPRAPESGAAAPRSTTLSRITGRPHIFGCLRLGPSGPAAYRTNPRCRIEWERSGWLVASAGDQPPSEEPNKRLKFSATRMAIASFVTSKSEPVK